MWLDRVKKVYGDDLEITWKNFSLEQINSKEGPEWKSWEQGEPTERRSLLSQMAAEAARRQGRELYDKSHLAWLTARHGGDDRIALNEEEPLIELAKDVGLDVGRFQEDLKDRELAGIIGRDHEEAAAEGLGAIVEGEMGEIAERPWGERSFYAHDPFGNPVCFVDERTLFTGGRFVP